MRPQLDLQPELAPRPSGALVDAHGRVVKDLRISVTPRCNLHCTYCDPVAAQHREPSGIVTVQEVDQLVRAAAGLGLTSVRFTGGEPLLRRELHEMIANARQTPGVQDVSITTNGLIFRKRHRELMDAGLQRINISVDALDPRVFAAMTGGGVVDRVLDAVELALELKLHPVKLNAVLVRGGNETEIVPLARQSKDRPLHVRFIEYMHLNNADQGQYAKSFLSGAEARRRIEAELGPLTPVQTDPASPARVFRLEGALGTVGFIEPISRPFCSACSRMRLTADKKLRPCLLTERELDARAAFESGDPAAALHDLLLLAAKKKGASGDILPVLRERTMVAIGG